MNSPTENIAQRLPLTALMASLVALTTLFVTTRNWIVAPVAAAMIGALFTKARLDEDSNFVRLGRYAIFGLILWQAVRLYHIAHIRIAGNGFRLHRRLSYAPLKWRFKHGCAVRPAVRVHRPRFCFRRWYFWPRPTP